MGYSPTLGRWLEPDPVGYVDGMNVHQYVGSNPATFVDPWGLHGMPTVPSGNGFFNFGTGETISGGVVHQPTRPPYAAPNSTATGADLFQDFATATGPKNRNFKAGDYLTGVMARKDAVTRQRQAALAAIQQYCKQGGTGPLPKIPRRFESRDKSDLSSGGDSAVLWALSEVWSIITGGDMGYIGTFTGGWEVIKVDCTSCCATISWRLNNTMSLKSALYNNGPNVNQTRPLQTIKQSWMWHETICWGNGGIKTKMLPPA